MRRRFSAALVSWLMRPRLAASLTDSSMGFVGRRAIFCSRLKPAARARFE